MSLKSLDTNILVYAGNKSCREHKRAAALVDSMLQNPEEWILADQVLWEFFVVIQKSPVLTKTTLSGPGSLTCSLPSRGKRCSSLRL